MATEALRECSASSSRAEQRAACEGVGNIGCLYDREKKKKQCKGEILPVFCKPTRPRVPHAFSPFNHIDLFVCYF